MFANGHSHRTKSRRHVRFGSIADMCAAKGNVRFTPIATAKADSCQTGMSTLLLKADMCGALAHDPQKRTCAIRCLLWARSRHVQRTTRVRQGPKGGSHFKVRWAGKLVIGDHVTGFLIIAAVGAASARPSRPLRAQQRI